MHLTYDWQGELSNHFFLKFCSCLTVLGFNRNNVGRNEAKGTFNNQRLAGESSSSPREEEGS